MLEFSLCYNIVRIIACEGIGNHPDRDCFVHMEADIALHCAGAM
jgi:hypothetical protein